MTVYWFLLEINILAVQNFAESYIFEVMKIELSDYYIERSVFTVVLKTVYYTWHRGFRRFILRKVDGYVWTLCV